MTPALLAAWAVCRDRLPAASIVVSLIAIGMSLYSAGLNRGLALSSEWERRYDAERDRVDECRATLKALSAPRKDTP